MSHDTTGTETTKHESATTESTMWEAGLKSEECAAQLKADPTQVMLRGVVTHVGVCEYVMERLHPRIVCCQPR